MSDRKDTQRSAIFCSEKEALSVSFCGTNGVISIAYGLYNIRLQTACLHLPSSEQAFLDLALLQFANSKRFLATPKQMFPIMRPLNIEG